MKGVPPALVYSPVKHRHRLAASAIGAVRAQILDVGGYKSRAAHFAPLFQAVDYTSINVGPAWYVNEECDVTYDGGLLPYSDRSFQFVTSIDTLEHIPAARRRQMITEIVRVAAVKAVIVVPVSHGDTSEEERFLEYSRLFGIQAMPSLSEHVRFGLPTMSELEVLLEGMPHTITFATPRNLYWSFQIAMLLNQAVSGNSAEGLNRRLNGLMEDVLEGSMAEQLAFAEAYRAVITVVRDHSA